MAKPVIYQPNRTTLQIVDSKGSPSKAAHTEPLWVDKSQTDVFSAPTQGNKIVSFTTGAEYFSNLIEACDSANTSIYIAGWQVAWDALLKPGVRLYDLVYRNALRGVNVYVMPWDDTEPVQTYDDQTKFVLESINELLEEAGSKGRVHVELCKSYASVNNRLFSHHQKQVIVDRKIAYVGGIDLTYGRFDDETFDLRADSHGREVLNRYNPGVPALKTPREGEVPLVDPDLMKGGLDRTPSFNRKAKYFLAPSNRSAQMTSIQRGGWQVRYAPAGGVGNGLNKATMSANTVQSTVLDPARQPRMPWQDVHSRIEGPAVSHLIRNFVRRWNTLSTAPKLKPAEPPTSFEERGNAHIQVLRSAPANHCAVEKKANGSDISVQIDKDSTPKTQQDIHVAMQMLIAKARRFIYIENQFFVSDFGKIGGETDVLSPAAQYIKDGPGGIGDTGIKGLTWLTYEHGKLANQLPQNKILPCLLARFKKVILDDIHPHKFHVYITVPVHPEGSVIDASVAVQVYFTMQTLVNGSQSLINGLKRLIKARELKDKKDPDFERVLDDDCTEHQSVPVEKCYEYVTLLNLRNWAQLGKTYVTEQIYVHTKLMIVDDRFALLGSANINDRSLLGERDSEIAILVQDNDSLRADINGKGSNQPVRVFAHELRIKIWNKIFGITGNVHPATNLKTAIEQPGHPESWNRIQEQAAANTAIYEAAFPFIPRNMNPNERQQDRPARILPTWNDTNSKLGYPLPCQDIFWASEYHKPETASLKNVRGFITALPLRWAEKENIWIHYPTALIVQNDAGDDEPYEKQRIITATNDSNSSREEQKA